MKTETTRIKMFDGAMGTMLQRRGLKLREVPESLNVNNPDVIRSIHNEYLAAGSDYVQTNTFGANPYKLAGTGYDTETVIRAAIEIARSAAEEHSGKGVLLDIGPSGRAMAPVGDADFDEIYDSVARQVKAGASDCDGILIETFTDLLEAKATVLAALENSDKPVYLTMSFQEDGRTFFGTPVEAMIMTFEKMGLAGLGVNCSLGPRQLLPIVKTLTEHSRIPVIVQPNAGLPTVRNGVSTWDITPDEFALYLRRFADMGAVFLGGCCGTNPEYIAKANAAIGDRAARPREVRPLNGVCSATHIENLGDATIIGERLNPTGKKRLKQAIYDKDYDYLVLEAQKQEEQGAQILDVNVGLPDIDEKATLTAVVKELQSAIDLPLQLDSSNPEALESAARRYAGKPLINSVSGKEHSLAAVLPIAKKYGAALIGLTLDDSGIPATAEERFAVAEKIISRAESAGIPREDILIDTLTLTASAQQKLVLETVKAVRAVTERLGVKTALGVSNVSFGLPRRPLINRTMLAAALANGLTAAIINPGEKNCAETIRAWRVMNGQDKDAKDYIDYCASAPEDVSIAKSASPQQLPTSQSEETADPLTSAVSRGLKDQAHEEAKKLLSNGKAPLEIIEKTLIPALDAVGKNYETGEIYLPQLIKSADAARSALDVIKTALAKDSGGAATGPKVVIATVYGDVHDIGKNIVKVIMENYNFDVLDLGKDVPPEEVVKAVKETGAKIVGLSALMTTTVASMKDTIALLRRECPDVRVIVGGAVLTKELAKYVNADSYARDAMDTVRAAQE